MIYLQLNNLFQKIKENKLLHFTTFVILFLIILGLLSLIPESPEISKVYATITSNVLSTNGFENEMFFTGDSYGLKVKDVAVNIGEVCTGLFELFVFLALIFATLVVNIKKKIIGSLILIVLFFFLNLIRIYLMIMLFLYANPFVTDVLHTVLFKLGFFIFFVLFYYLWLTYSTKKGVSNATL